MRVISNVRELLLCSRPKPWALEKPIVIQFPINDICNAGCQMCHIWKKKLDYQITPAELDAALSNRLYSEVTSVGVNGGEPTLRKDIGELVEVLFNRLPKLRSISLITNALVSKKVIRAIDVIGQVVKVNNAKFDVMVSLDGVGDVHDRVRGRKGNFENALAVVSYIKVAEYVTSYRLGCTIIKDNVYGLHDLHDFAIKNDIYVKYRLGVPHRRLYTDHIKAPFLLTQDEKIHVCEFLEGVIKYYDDSVKQKFFYRSLIDQIIRSEPRKAGCDWQHRGVTISARGELLYCAVESDALGLITDEDSERLYFGNQSHIDEIVMHKCDSCAHDYVGLMPAAMQRRELISELLSKFGVPSIDKITQLRLLGGLRGMVKRNKFRSRLENYTRGRIAANSAMKFRDRPAGSQVWRVMICGWYGTETLGDKAILAAIVRAVRNELGSVDFSIASLEPYVSEQTNRQMPELHGCKVLSVKDGIDALAEMDLLVFGGGPLMAISNMAEMVALFEMATQCAVPSIVAGCGVGPLGEAHHNDAITRLLNAASIRIFRDEAALKNAALLGIDVSRDTVADDPALSWVHQSGQTHGGDSAGKVSTRLTLLLGLRDWPFQQYAREMPKKEAIKIKEEFDASIVEALAVLGAEYDEFCIIPFPMCTNHYGGDDRWYYREIFRHNESLSRLVDYSVLNAEMRPADALAVFHRADVVLAMRFHALLFALGLGLPVMAVDYTLGRGKVAALAERFSVPNRSLDKITSDFLVKNIMSLAGNNGKSSAAAVSMTPAFPQAIKSAIGSLRS